ncbi:chemotaxis protein CheB [Stigmatella aurantiaca]|uniref:protein-glutamate methylesterase n=1 Tax=Stigmatella aurantiaca (strain DW4/3-1) TaxID=378806 RepID=Q09B13_STIAD|nr:chemotaxis protein CheB [Stigmatella aurantiaca]ADO72366.1 Protein-glutamate methylesterase FrzG [Stigmatella aurantiaca DW4/3-1]EAU68917.1 protein-glutamate methylesterase FrzG [Stigmatella aurantiaca DW4/3-1]
MLLVGSGLRLLARHLFQGETLTSAGECSFADALDTVEDETPDVILVDLTSVEALEAIAQVMAERPTPILAMSSGVLTRDEAFKALALGALDVVERSPVPGADFWQSIARQLVMLSQVRVVRHVQGKVRRRAHPPPADGAEPPFPLVAIAASLGGPRALSILLRSLPKDFPAAVCICQHISVGFTEGLAHWLASETGLRVMEAPHDEKMLPGTAYIAPSGAHLVVRPEGWLQLDPRPPVRGFRPSCDLLLSSAAESFGRRCIGVILTGMGKDGARGLKEIRERGGRTIAQNAETCVVYGMPREAVQLGAAEEILPLDRIGPTLLEWVETC